MLKRILGRLTYANLMATTAVFIAIGGGAYAAGLAKNSVKSKQIKNGAVKTADLKNNAVKGAKVKDGSLTGGDLLDGSVGSADVTDESLTSGDLGPDSVGTTEIQTDGVAATEVQDNSLDSGEIIDNSLFSADLGSGSVRATELGTITQRSAVSADIAAGGLGNVTASCLAGEKMISGGNDGFGDLYVVASRQAGNGWAVYAHNASGSVRNITAYAYCLQAS
jgi:hypothetical protein